MFDVVKKLLLARQLSLEKGHIKLLEVPVNVIPVSVIAYLEKILIDTFGYEEARKKIYQGGYEGGRDFCNKFVERYRMKTPREIIEWELNIVTMAGWGELELKRLDAKKGSALVIVKNSSVAEMLGPYGKSIDFFMEGFMAGGSSIALGMPMKVTEVKCKSKGDSFCEFLFESEM
ncbi:MAG: V4R domain-containing protein [archaeon]